MEINPEIDVSVISVRKRDGKTVQKFNVDKIKNAVEKAWTSTGWPIYVDGVNAVCAVASKRISNYVGQEIGVEKIQDEVECALMECGYGELAKSYIIYREKRSDLRNLRKHPDPAAISDYMWVAKYANYKEDFMRRETYEEIIQRVEETHIRKFSYDENIVKQIKWAFKFVYEKRLLPSMRFLQFGGKAIEANNTRGYNCSFSYCDRPRFFAEALYMLLCGTGVGFSVQFDHIEKLPSLKYIDESLVRHFTIPDTIEGWADGLNALINSYIKGNYVEFNYSKIRDRGEPLKTSGGKAPGHMALKRAFDNIRSVLHSAQGRKLRSIECHDIVCLAADAVLSGGIRRSSLISLFSLEDSEMMHAKTGNWYTKYPWRANANNSVVLKRDEVKKKQFKRIFEKTQQFGEPGFLFVDDYNAGTNPCQPGWATVLTPQGVRTFSDIEIGSTIWSGKQWTKVIKKWSTGIKPVYKYSNNAGIFVGTENHMVVSNGIKVQVKDAESIDVCWEPDEIHLKEGIVKTFKINSIEYVGDEEVFDITVDASGHTYWTGGLLVSNCAEVSLNGYLTVDEEVMGMIEAKRSLGEQIPQVKIGQQFSGFQVCNLCEINAAKLTSLEDFKEVARAASIIGTLQASYTDFPYLGWVSELIIEREALLGVGMTGIMDSPNIAANPEYQREAAQLVVDTNKTFSKEIGIKQAARTNVVKPAGSSSLALGCVGSGIHPHHARRYIRRITANAIEPVFLYFKSINPHMCVKKPNSNDFVIEFPVEAPSGAVVKSDLSAIQFLDMVKSTQQNWVIPGTARPESSPGLTHNVSNTCTVKEDEWDSVAEYLWDNKLLLSGVSLLSDIGDKLYSFAPCEAIVSEVDEAKWNYLVSNYTPVDYSKMKEESDNTNLTGEAACVAGKCDIL